MKRFLYMFAGVLIIILAGGAWLFMHPKMPPLRETFGDSQQQIDERVGLFLASGDDDQWLIVPALTSGYYKMPVDRWTSFTKLSPKELAAQPLSRIEPQPYSIEQVNAQNDVELSGWLFEPNTPAKAGVVLLHGSGDSHRANSWYVYLTHFLASSGYTVILPDKRGSGRSEGDWRSASLHTLAGDGVAWIDYLRSNTDLQKVGVIGVSQGGTIAPETVRRAQADFAIALSAAAVPLKDQLLHEVANDIKEAEAPDLIRPALTSIYTVRAKNRYAEFWEKNADYDMLEEWLNWGGPFFVAYGEKDEERLVPIGDSIQALKKHSEEPRLVWSVYEDVGHGLTYEDGKDEGIFQLQFQTDILNWLEGMENKD